MVPLSYRRTYMPSSYHIVQELQKYNIPDYRPRQEQYVLLYIPYYLFSSLLHIPGFRKPSKKFGPHSVCAAIAVLPSVRRRMRASRIKPSLSEPTIRQWPAQGPLVIRFRDLTGGDNVLYSIQIILMICNAPVNFPVRRRMKFMTNTT